MASLPNAPFTDIEDFRVAVDAPVSQDLMTDIVVNENYLFAALSLPGEVRMWAGPSAPTSWLFCDGSAISRTTYAALFAIIGTTFGVGNGTTTFNIPDVRGRAPIGVGTGSGLTARALAATGGEETHLLTTAEIPAHTHTQQTDNGGGAVTVLGPGSAIVRNPLNAGETASTGGGGVHNNMQPFLALNFIIRY